MASNFPASIDPFINPVYTKVNGVDYVKAEHVNDLQDAVRNIEICIAGAGLNMGIASNNYIPESSSVKNALEILDGALKLRQDAFELHVASVMPTDPFQHHGNVIQVTSIGNLSSTRVQQALEELQVDIDSIMTGGFVEGNTLDNRYILKSGPALITGTLTVQNKITGLQDAEFGTSISHTLTASGSMIVGKDLTLGGALTLGGNITLPNVSKIGAKDFLEYTNISFVNSGMQIKTINDLVITLDADDATDGLATTSNFIIQNGLGSTVLSVDEDGILSVAAKIATLFADLDSHLLVGSSSKTRIEHDKLDVPAASFLIKLDSDNNEIGSTFVVTKDGDLGASDTSTNILLKATSNQIIAGNHVLTRGVPEVGYFGMKFHSDNAGGKFHGIGVNFKSKMLTAPSSVTLSIDPTKSSNYNNVTITDITPYGFFVECDSITIGHVELKGTYTTIGN